MLISDFFQVTPEKPLFFGSNNLCIHPCKEPDCLSCNRYLLPRMHSKMARNRKGQGA